MLNTPNAQFGNYPWDGANAGLEYLVPIICPVSAAPNDADTLYTFKPPSNCRVAGIDIFATTNGEPAVPGVAENTTIEINSNLRGLICDADLSSEDDDATVYRTEFDPSSDDTGLIEGEQITVDIDGISDTGPTGLAVIVWLAVKARFGPVG